MKRGIALFAHGSRDAQWNAPIEAVAQCMRELAPDVPVACAYLELTAPDLPQAVQALCAQGVTHLTVWPMFLGMGRHVRQDLPRLLGELRRRWPALHIEQAPPIGSHPSVVLALARTALAPR